MRKIPFISMISLIAALMLGCLTLGGQQAAAVDKPQEKTPEYNPGHKYTPEQLLEDFQLLRTALEEAHSGIYFYTPKEALDGYFNSAKEKLTGPMTELEFYGLIAPVVEKIHDGHTWPRFSTACEEYLQQKPISFPFNLRFLKGKAYVYRNFSENMNIPAVGSEVLSINGHPMKEILEKMLVLVPGDAHIETIKYRRLERASVFNGFYTLSYGEAAEYTVNYRDYPGGKEKTVKVKGLTWPQFMAIYSERYPEDVKDKPPIKLEFKDDAAILTISTFGNGPYQNQNIVYPDFMKSTFSQLLEKKIQYLVIDLRNNSGGADDFGKILFAYLYDKPFKYYESLRMKTIELSFWDKTGSPGDKAELEKELAKNQEGTYDVLNHPNLGEQQPLLPTFKGKVLILINGGSFSATGESTSLIHYYKKAKFAGEECGAGYYGNTSGYAVSLELPNTRLRIAVPMIRYSMAVSGYPRDRGIIPDYPIEPEISDLVNGKDPVMDFALKQVKKL